MPKRRPPAPEEGVLVGSGSFGIDARRAVDVLRRRQLQQTSETAPLLWVRLAVQSGASRASLLSESGRFEVRFDGRPLPPIALSRPYDAYLGSVQGDEAARLFGLALLHLARDGVGVEVISGRGDRRAALYTDGPGAQPPVPMDDEGSDTVVRAVWAPPTPVPEGHPQSWDLEEAGARLDSCPIPVTLGHPGHPRPLLPWCRRFGREAVLNELDGARCGMRVLPLPGGTSVLKLAVQGVAAETAKLDPLPLPVEGWVDDARFTLSASLDSVVRDARREAALKAANRAAVTAFQAALDRHARRMRLAAVVLRRGAAWRGVWDNELQRRDFDGPDSTPRSRLRGHVGLLSRPTADGTLVTEAALWARAFRAALRRLPKSAERGPLWEALQQAPTSFGPGYKPLPPRAARP